MSLRWGNETVARTKTKETEKHKPPTRNSNGANLGFEAQLFLAADKKPSSPVNVRNLQRAAR
jgi:hypothetical protein